MPVDPNDSIKEQILDTIAEVTLRPLLNPEQQKVRDIRREVDPLAEVKKLPMLLVFDGDEDEARSEKDNRGRRYTFPLVLQWLTNAKGDAFHRERKAIIPEIQRLIETDISLGGLTVQIDGGEERPFASLQQPVRGSFVYYWITYRRLRGDPKTTY